jgi:hypothetical protein
VRARIAAQGVKIRMPRGGQFSRAVDTYHTLISCLEVIPERRSAARRLLGIVTVCPEPWACVCC